MNFKHQMQRNNEMKSNCPDIITNAVNSKMASFVAIETCHFTFIVLLYFVN